MECLSSKSVKDMRNLVKGENLGFENFLYELNNVLKETYNLKWEKRQKIQKGIFQTIGIFLGLLGLGLAVISWNNSEFISACISVVMSIGFGLVKMGDVERMWTEGWLEYEMYVDKKLTEAQNKPNLELSDTDSTNISPSE